MQHGVAQETGRITLALNGQVNIDFVQIRPGKFMMGSPASDTLAHSIEKPQREVEIKQEFYMSVTPVTIKQFKVFIEETGYKTIAETDEVGGHGYNQAKRKFEGLFPQYNWRNTGWSQSDNHPVVNISWIDANQFCQWLTAKTGKKVTLPAEDEWEYACRAGTKTLFFTGDSPNSLEKYANISDDALREQLKEGKNSSRTFPFNDGFAFTSPVESFKPNPWGLYDMLGNVWQICDGFLPGGNSIPDQNHVAKGGSYNSYPEFVRCAIRGRIKATSKYGYFGFRVVVRP